MLSKLDNSPIYFISPTTYEPGSVASAIKLTKDLIDAKLTTLDSVMIDTDIDFSFTPKGNVSLRDIETQMQNIIDIPVSYVIGSGGFGAAFVRNDQDDRSYVNVKNIDTAIGDIENLNNLVIGEVDLALTISLVVGDRPEVVELTRSLLFADQAEDFIDAIAYIDNADPVPDFVLMDLSYTLDHTTVGTGRGGPITDTRLTDIIDSYILSETEGFPMVVSKEVNFVLLTGEFFLNMIGEVYENMLRMNLDHIPDSFDINYTPAFLK